MPYESISTSDPFYTFQYRWNCKPWQYTSLNGTGSYTSYSRQYNDPQHRIKPDPLTDTALAKQYTQRLKPSTSDYMKLTSQANEFGCPIKKAEIWKKFRAVAEYSPVIPSVTLDWEQKVLQALAERFVNIGDSVAEYRATASSFYGYAVGVRNAWRRWKGLKKGRVKLTPCDVTAAELAYSFGIAPLAEDVFSAVEALRLAIERPIHMPFFETVTAYGKVNPTPPSSCTSYQRKYRVSNRVSGIVELEPSFKSAITVSNPLSWAWELIPFSFVVDWGIPIGNYLQGLDMLRRIHSVKGTRTIKESYTAYWKAKDTASAPYNVSTNWGKLSYKSHERKLLSSIPVPPLPRWKPSLSWHKVYRAMTLLIAVNQPCRRYSGRRR